nr:hypothetical protein [Tanacetum cinerariifolium]
LVPIPSEFEGIPDTIDDDSLYKENIKYVEASPHDSELVSLEAAEIVILKVKEIKDDNLRKKLLNFCLLIANIEALKDNPASSSEFLTKSSSTSLKSFSEETNTFHNSLPEFENFFFDWKRLIVAIPLLILIYLFRIMKLSISMTIILKRLVVAVPLLILMFLFLNNLPDPGELISILNSGIRENPPSTPRVNLPIEDDHSPLLAYVVWIFLAYPTYPVIPPYLHPFENEDTIFDPGITINRVYSFKPGLSHQCGAFKKFNTY